MTRKITDKPSRTLQISLILSFIIVGITFFLMLFVQPNGDDFCFLAAPFDKSIDNLGFSSGRWTTGVFYNSLYLLGEVSTIVIPIIGSFLLLGSLFLLVKTFFKKYKIPSTLPVILTIAFSFYLTFILSLQYFYQTVFWSPAVIVYIFPISCLNLLISVLLRNSPTKAKTIVALIAFLSLFILLSNQVFLLLIGFLACCVAYVAVTRKSKYWLAVSLTVFITCLIALIIYKTAPTTIARFNSYDHTASYLEIANASIYGYLKYIKGLFFSNLIQSLAVLFYIGVLLAVVRTNQKIQSYLNKIQLIKIFWFSIFSSISLVVLSVAIIALLYYAQNGFPAPRVMSVVQYLNMIWLTIVVVSFATLLIRVKNKTHQIATQIGVLLFIVVGAISMLITLKNLYPQVISYGQAITQQADRIEQEKALGFSHHIVTTQTIPSMGQPDTDENFWLNICMASWYDTHSVSASPLETSN